MQYAADRTEAFKLMGSYYWLIRKQNKALAWWNKSIKVGEHLGARPELARTYKEQKMYMRLIQAKYKPDSLSKIQPGKMEEFRKIYTEQIIPALQAIRGCRYAYLTENIEQKNEFLSVTIWDSRQDADNYEKSSHFNELKDKIKHTFLELYQWKMALEKEQKGQVVTSEDLTVKTFNMVTGKSFQ